MDRVEGLKVSCDRRPIKEQTLLSLAFAVLLSQSESESIGLLAIVIASGLN